MVAACVAVAVPLMAQVLLSILNPVGKVGLAEQEVTVPETVGVAVVIAASLT